jgi:hypothetical protein
MNIKQIEGYPKYAITIDGDVYSHKYTKPRKLKPQRASQSKKGYLQCRLYDNSGELGKLQYVHRLVWESFKYKIPKGLEIDHIDGNPRNNSLSNLQLLTRRGNTEKYNRKKYKVLLRDFRDELIQDYETLGTFKKVAKKWRVSIAAVNRVIRNRMHTKLPNGKYGTITYDKNINDKYSL